MRASANTSTTFLLGGVPLLVLGLHRDVNKTFSRPRLLRNVIPFSQRQLTVNVYNPSAPGNQHFCELLPTANDVINIYMTSNSTGNARFSCERSV